MPNNGKELKTLDQLLAYAKTAVAAQIEEDIQVTPWEELFQNNRMRVTDFAQKYIVGYNEYELEMDHEVPAMALLIEQMPEGPGKQAAKIVYDRFRTCYDLSVEYKANSKLYAAIDDMRHPRYQMSPGAYRDQDNISKDPKVRISKALYKEAAELERQNSANMNRNNEMLLVCSAFLESFFARGAVMPKVDDGRYGEIAMQCEAELMAELAEKLPNEPEYETYKRREDYVDRPVQERTIRAAKMVMNPNVLTNITANNYPELIHKANPSVLDLEWGAGTFDAMMDGIYSHTDRKAFKREGRTYLETVFLDGKRATEMFPYDEAVDKDQSAYVRRVKAEVTAYALEGKGKLDICPYKAGSNVHDLGDPIPVQVNVNLEEKHSGWRKILNIFGVKATAIKKMAERVSLDRLTGEEDRREKIREAVKLEKENFMMKEAVEGRRWTQKKNDQAFFGWLVDPELGKDPAALSDALYHAVPSAIGNSLDTMTREGSRESIVGLFALHEGMTLDELVSEDPALNARKAEIGRRFVEKVKIMDEKEFHEKNGKDAEYQTYVARKNHEIYNMYIGLHQVLGQQPMDIFLGKTAEELAANYKKMDFLTQASQDIYQSPTPGIKQVNADELNQLEMKNRSIGESRYIMDYCAFIAGDSYAAPDISRSEDRRAVTKALIAKSNMDSFQEECRILQIIGTIHQRANEAWAFNAGKCMSAFALSDDSIPERFKERIEFLRTGRNPVHHLDKKTGQYVIGSVAEIKALKAKEQESMNWKDFEVIDAPEKKAQAKPAPEKVSFEKEFGGAKLMKKK